MGDEGQETVGLTAGRRALRCSGPPRVSWRKAPVASSARRRLRRFCLIVPISPGKPSAAVVAANGRKSRPVSSIACSTVWPCQHHRASQHRRRTRVVAGALAHRATTICRHALILLDPPFAVLERISTPWDPSERTVFMNCSPRPDLHHAGRAHASAFHEEILEIDQQALEGPPSTRQCGVAIPY